MKSGTDHDFPERIAELLGLLEGEENRPARELVRLVLELHGQALLAILEKIQDEALIERIGADARVQGVLLLHGLHPEPAEARVRRALRSFAPLSVEDLGVANGELFLRVKFQGTLRPGERLREKVERAVFDAAPELAAARIEGLPVEKPFIPLVQEPSRT